jgi:NAD(P)-dependent dehydrogenase (short-subunit alcohol dehydrogenase family)
MDRLKNKVIIVTGGNGLIGKEIIKSIDSEGGLSINFDINHENDIKNHLVKCDITNERSVIDSLKFVHTYFGRIDGLVNNAYPRTKDWGLKFEDIPIDSWKENVDWQLNSYFFITQQVAAYMKESRKGSIVNIGSIYGVVGPDFTVYNGTTMTMPAAYAAIKGGIVNLTRYLSSYLGPDQIRINVVSPGGIFDNQNPIFIENYNKKVPMRRMGLPDDISPAVVFLLSDEAKYITGQNIVVDGGWTAI